jgi:hypothetical protein
MLLLLLEGALAGAALFGLAVAILGGASLGLVAAFWGLGLLLALGGRRLCTWRGESPGREI